VCDVSEKVREERFKLRIFVNEGMGDLAVACGDNNWTFSRVTMASGRSSLQELNGDVFYISFSDATD
jgi:hypothetical protein